jgi:hypothetical protein
MPKKLSLAILLGAIFLTLDTALGDTAVVIGSCNIVQQKVTISNGSTVINVCTPPSIEESFALRFAWLNSDTTSLMMAGYFDPSLRPLFGTEQMVVENAVYNRIKEILARFGSPKRKESDGSKDSKYRIASGQADDLEFAESSIPTAVLKHARFYDGESTILLPEVGPLATLLRSDGWPMGYRLTYYTNSNVDLSVPLDFKNASYVAENSVLACTLLYQALPKASFDRYWEDMNALEEFVTSNKIDSMKVTNINVDREVPWRKSGQVEIGAQQNKAIEALRYFGAASWPADFVFGFGGAANDNCAGTRLGFYAQPRRLFTLVAIIESRVPTLEIQKLHFTVDQDANLRPLKSGSTAEESTSGAIVLRMGEAALVPLRLELKYDLDAIPLSAVTKSDEPQQIYNMIASSPVAMFHLREPAPDYTDENQKLSVVLRKSKAVFRAPEVSAIKRSYIFGPSYELHDIVIKDKIVLLRNTPAFALFRMGQVDGGSCPFLFVDDETTNNIKIGRVLIGAVGIHNKRVESIALPEKTQSVFVTEQEPEVTHLIRVAVLDDSLAEETIIGTDLEIWPGQTVKFEIPSTMRSHPKLLLEGFYKPLISEARTKQSFERK